MRIISGGLGILAGPATSECKMLFVISSTGSTGVSWKASEYMYIANVTNVKPTLLPRSNHAGTCSQSANEELAQLDQRDEAKMTVVKIRSDFNRNQFVGLSNQIEGWYIGIQNFENITISGM